MASVVRTLAAVAVLVLLAGTAAAHVPAFAGAGNESPSTAYEVRPPTKSWAIYTSLDAGGVRYFELRLDAGERLELALFTPASGGFAPSMVVMSPAIDADEPAPPGVTVPTGYGTVVVEGDRPAEPSYEPNTPAAIYETASYGRTVEEGGRYLVAVYAPSGRGGQVGVVAGDRESFTARQYLTVAWDLPRVYLWSGDGPLIVFGPPLVVVAAGYGRGRRRIDGLGRPRLRTALALSGLVVAGSALAVTVQMVQALAATGPAAGAVLTAVFVAIPLAMGGLLVRLATDPGFELTWTGRALLAVAALGSLGTWAGYLVAPLVPLAVAAWPRNPFGR